MKTGAAKCWGDNRFGELGTGTNVNSTTPVDVSALGTNVAAITAGFTHTCALTTAGAVMCWGDNTSGQLGDGTTTNSPTPVPVVGLQSGVASISAGPEYTCAVMSNGTAKCWGDNYWGELGNGASTNSTTPVEVSGLTGLSGVVAISAGGETATHTCAFTNAGAAWCWGNGSYGENGDGRFQSGPYPGAVTGLDTGVAGITAGGDNSCAVTAAGAAKCWGDNALGQLGDGTTVNRATPVEVIWF
jgi:alpha-tubulin suppressor-like RCC1 family protein